MCSRRSTRKSRAADRTGFTLIEMLVAILLAAIALAVFARDFGFTVRNRQEMDLVVETQQALHATETFITQEVRQAGACLPANGEFVALAGEDNGPRDSLTLRVGLADRTTLLCVQTILTGDSPAGSRRLDVQSTTGFDVGQMIYVTRQAGSGDLFRVASVGSDFLLVEGSLDADFVSGGGVYALEERRYALQDFDGVPALMVSIDGGEPQPMVAGVEELEFRYRTAPCPPCDAVDLPASSAQWRTVREVEMRVVARSLLARRDGEFLRLSQTTTIKPRNLI